MPALFTTGYAGARLGRQPGPGMAVAGKPFTIDATAAEVGATLEAVGAR